MRNLTIAFLWLFPSFVVAQTTQSSSLAGGSYEFTEYLPEEMSKQLIGDTKTPVEVIDGYKVKVLYEANGQVYYKYWSFEDDSSSAAKKYNGPENELIFNMDKSQFLQITKPLYHWYKGVSFGTYTIPFRLRGIGGQFDFESSLSLQSNLVFGVGRSTSQESWLDGSIGIGLTSINLNSTNSDLATERTATAFTFSLGGVLKPAPYANVGVFVGWDFLGKKDREANWTHNKNTWVGLGINVGFNAPSTVKPANEDKQ